MDNWCFAWTFHSDRIQNHISCELETLTLRHDNLMSLLQYLGGPRSLGCGLSQNVVASSSSFLPSSSMSTPYLLLLLELFLLSCVVLSKCLTRKLRESKSVIACRTSHRTQRELSRYRKVSQCSNTTWLWSDGKVEQMKKRAPVSLLLLLLRRLLYLLAWFLLYLCLAINNGHKVCSFIFLGKSDRLSKLSSELSLCLSCTQ